MSGSEAGERITAPSNRSSILARTGGVLKRALMLELRVYESLWRFLARRPAIAPGAVGVGYHKPVLTVLWIFIVLSAVEIPIIDLIVHRWPPVRIAMLVLGVWGVTWMLGLLCAMLTRPHTVGLEGIRVRQGLELDVALGWDDIASVAITKHVDEPKSPRVADGVLAVRQQDETNLELVLERPTTVRLPGPAPRGGAHEVEVVRFWADDPRAVLDAARPFLVGEPAVRRD
ncbi:hypothetical protein [Agromyces soli]|uniref:PH domain-containing protein n=1 Tax=Agromyces soli TaxID=659012 RepID=A0ABY4ATI4_9MICO|nr:hypothetical protein [Agromyces soli]UOE25717.1 hypothetical protein MTP13_15545 [Agromyces soli]